MGHALPWLVDYAMLIPQGHDVQQLPALVCKDTMILADAE